MAEEAVKIPQLSRPNGWQKLAALKKQMCVSKVNDGANGRYKYYTAANIYDEAKKFLPEVGGDIVTSDVIEEHLGKLFVTCTARFIDIDTGEVVVETKGNAWLEHFSGQNEAQSSGTASTYAKKRALSGLLSLETDEKDPDEIGEDKDKGAKPAQQNPQNPKKILADKLQAAGVDPEAFTQARYNASFSQMPVKVAEEILKDFSKILKGYQDWKAKAEEEIPL